VREWGAVIDGRPVSKGNSGRMIRRGGRVFRVSSDAATAHEAHARRFAMISLPSGYVPIAGPITLECEFRFAIPKSKAKSVRPGDPHVSKVDRGNLLKLLEDALKGVIYVDDSQIVGGDVRKCWGERNETWVRVVAIDE